MLCGVATDWWLMWEFQENYTARRIVLAASGVDHEEIVSIAEPLLSDLPSGPRSEEPQSKYVGGEYRLQASPSVCISAHSDSQLQSWFSLSTYIPHYLILLQACLSAILLLCQETHIALAFEVPGGWRQEKQAILLTVLQVSHLSVE